MRNQTEIKELIVHHSASHLDTKIEDIRRWHLKRGFRDVGYHFVIEANPVRIAYGRDPWQVGAHAPPNTGRLGLCIVGDNTRPEHAWQDEQIHVAMALIESIRLVYPRLAVRSHSKVGGTVCPGREISALVT